jgi:hypothetical protein
MLAAADYRHHQRRAQQCCRSFAGKSHAFLHFPAPSLELPTTFDRH